MPLSICSVSQGGEPYPPTYAAQLAFLWCMQEHYGDTPDFLSKKDVHFRDLRECTFSDLRKKGVWAGVKLTPVIIIKEEDQLRQTGVMETDTLKQLLNTVFFYVEKVFCLKVDVERG